MSPSNEPGKYLGKDAHGYSYRLLGDGYVYNYRPDGTRVGYLCDEGAWNRTYHVMIVVKP